MPLRTWVWLLAVLSTAALAWLVVRHEPLPFDIRTSALIATLFCLLATAALVLLQRLPLLSFPSLFLAITFLFTCSSFILYQLEGTDTFRFWKVVDVHNVLVGMPVVMLAFSSFLVGALLVPPAHGRGGTGARNEIGTDPHTRALRNVGFAVYVISLVAVAGYSLSGSGLTFAFEGGYSGFTGARKAGELSQLLISALSWFLPWSLLILAATVEDRRSHVRVLLLSIPALAVMFLAGNRGQPLAAILLIGASSSLLGFRVDWKRSLAVVALVALLVPLIANLRVTPVSKWSPDVFQSSLGNQVQGTRTYGEGFLGALLFSMGQSYQTLMGTVMVVPSGEGYRYGGDYLKSLPLAVPFAHGLLKSLGADLEIVPPSQWIKSIINPTGRAGPGYLQVAEAYLEFGAIGVVGLYVILGWGLTRLWRHMVSRSFGPQELAFVLIFMMEMLVWIRNTSTGVVRDLVWAWLLVYAAPALLMGRRRVMERARASRRLPAYGSRRL